MGRLAPDSGLSMWFINPELNDTTKRVIAKTSSARVSVRRGSLKKELIMSDLWFVILVAVIVVSGGVKITFGNININNRNKNDD